MKSRNLAFIAIYAALYTVVSFFIIPLAFGAVQIRISGALLGCVPILGIPAVLGQTLGVLITNGLFSSVGIIDLINVVPTFIGAFVIWKLRNKTVIGGLLIYSTLTALSVSWMLSVTYQLDWGFTFVTVLIGQLIACVLLGWITYKVLNKRKLGSVLI